MGLPNRESLDSRPPSPDNRGLSITCRGVSRAWTPVRAHTVNDNDATAPATPARWRPHGRTKQECLLLQAC